MWRKTEKSLTESETLLGEKKFHLKNTDKRPQQAQMGRKDLRTDSKRF